MTKSEIIVSPRGVNYAAKDKVVGEVVDVQGSTEGVLLLVAGGENGDDRGRFISFVVSRTQRETHNPNPYLRRLTLQFPQLTPTHSVVIPSRRLP